MIVKVVVLFIIIAFTGSCKQQEKPPERENSMQMTDMHTSRIEGDLESEYILQKETARNPENFQNN